MATEQLVIDFGTLHDQAGAPKRNGRLVISGGTVAAVLAQDAPVAGTLELIQARCVVPAWSTPMPISSRTASRMRSGTSPGRRRSAGP